MKLTITTENVKVEFEEDFTTDKIINYQEHTNRYINIISELFKKVKELDK